MLYAILSRSDAYWITVCCCYCRIWLASQRHWFIYIVNATDKSDVSFPFLKSSTDSQCNLWGLKTHRCQSKLELSYSHLFNMHRHILIHSHTHNPTIETRCFSIKRFSYMESFNLWKWFLYHMHHTFLMFFSISLVLFDLLTPFYSIAAVLIWYPTSILCLCHLCFFPFIVSIWIDGKFIA